MPTNILLRYILVIALLLGVLLPAGVIFLIHPAVLASASEQARQESIMVANHLIRTMHLTQGPLSETVGSPEFAERCRQDQADFKLLKIKLFAPDGKVLFSTEPGDIGSVNPSPIFRERLPTGEIVSLTVQKGEESLEGQIFTQHLVETYVPLINEGGFVGAFELYFDITDQLRQLKRLLAISLAGLIFIILLFWAGLGLALWLAAKNFGLLEEAREKLARHNQQLAAINLEQQRLLLQAEEQHRREEELRKDENLKSLGTMAGGIAHDFNNLLTGILGNISLTQRLLADQPQALEILRGADLAGRHAAELVKQLLFFAKGGQAQRDRVDLTLLLPEATTAALAGLEQVEPRFSLAADLKPIEGDPAQLRQLFTNLVRNAGEAMPNGGTILIRAENLPESVDHLRRLRITIEDEGCGIAPELQKRIFDPYYSGKPLDHQKGRGLGLAICHAIIKHHHGTISVTSRPGHGTAITIDFPAVPADRTNAPPHGYDFSPTSPGKELTGD